MCASLELDRMWRVAHPFPANEDGCPILPQFHRGRVGEHEPPFLLLPSIRNTAGVLVEFSWWPNRPTRHLVNLEHILDAHTEYARDSHRER
jgi:hypothetical protein